MKTFEYPFEVGENVYVVEEDGTLKEHIVSDYSVAKNVIYLDDGNTEITVFDAKKSFYTEKDEAQKAAELQIVRKEIQEVIKTFPAAQYGGKFVNHGWSREEQLIAYALSLFEKKKAEENKINSCCVSGLPNENQAVKQYDIRF